MGCNDGRTDGGGRAKEGRVTGSLGRSVLGGGRSETDDLWDGQEHTEEGGVTELAWSAAVSTGREEEILVFRRMLAMAVEVMDGWD